MTPVWITYYNGSVTQIFQHQKETFFQIHPIHCKYLYFFISSVAAIQRYITKKQTFGSPPLPSLLMKCHHFFEASMCIVSAPTQVIMCPPQVPKQCTKGFVPRKSQQGSIPCRVFLGTIFLPKHRKRGCGGRQNNVGGQRTSRQDVLQERWYQEAAVSWAQHSTKNMYKIATGNPVDWIRLKHRTTYGGGH